MEKKSKKLYWGFKILSIIVSCALPLWAICEKFPIWQVEHGTTHTIGMGMILAAFVLLVIFRKTVFNFIIDHLDLRHAPPLSVWLVMLIVSYTLVYIGEIMRDMTNVFWMGFIGCVIGTFLTYISERFKPKDVNSNE
jgi:hypothetical protein